MNDRAYRALLGELCREIDLADAALLIRDGRLVIDEVEVALASEPGADAGHLWICVDFGAVPEHCALDAYRAMLESNLLAGGLDAGVRTLHARNGRNVLVVRRPLTLGLTGETLARMLSRYVGRALAWRAGMAGAEVGVCFDECADPCTIHVSIDFGPVALARQRDVYRALLLGNLHLGAAREAVVGLDPGTQRVVLAARVAFEDALDSERLAAMLRQWIAQVGGWCSSRRRVPIVRVAVGKRTWRSRELSS